MHDLQGHRPALVRPAQLLGDMLAAGPAPKGGPATSRSAPTARPRPVLEACPVRPRAAPGRGCRRCHLRDQVHGCWPTPAPVPAPAWNPDQAYTARHHIAAAMAFLDWLTARGLTLATCAQGDLDAWMASASTARKGATGHFVRWARCRKHTRLDFPATRWNGPARTLDTEARWDQPRPAPPRRGPRSRRPVPPRPRRPALRPAARSHQPPDPRSRPRRRRPGALAPRPGAHPAPRATRRPGTALGHHPPRPRRASATTAPRPGCCPADAPASPSAPTASLNASTRSASSPRGSPLYRPVPARRRDPGRHPRPHARHPHQRRRRVAARLQRRLGRLRRRGQPQDHAAARSVTSRNTGPAVTTAARCPVCGEQVPARDRPNGGRKARYCSGACKAKAYRARQQARLPATDGPPLAAAARHARAVEIRQQVSELAGTLADTASGQQALFAPPGTGRRARPAETAQVLHRLITELAALATAATVTKRATLHRPPGTPQTMPLFDDLVSSPAVDRLGGSLTALTARLAGRRRRRRARARVRGARAAGGVHRAGTAAGGGLRSRHRDRPRHATTRPGHGFACGTAASRS